MSLPQPSSGNEFSIGPVLGIPVRFSPWYLLLVGLVFWRTQDLQIGLIVLFCITMSVLLHELGHGLAGKHYGLRPSIVIHAFGGWCERSHISDRRKHLRIVTAGPAVSLGLAMIFWAIDSALPASTPYTIRLAASYMAGTNLLWGIFNLLPVLPMDGGRMLQLQLGYHVSASRADGITYWVGAIGGFVAAVGTFMYLNSFMMPLFLAVMAWQNAQKTAFHPFQTAFRGVGGPVARGGSGFELPPIVAAMVGALTGAAIAGIWTLQPDDVPRLLLAPSAFWSGASPWTALTAPFIHLDWGPLLYSITALWWFGPPVYRALNSPTKFAGLYLGALLAGSVCAVFLAAPLGQSDAYLYGAGAGSTALIVAWARFMAPLPVWPQVKVTPKQLAAFVLVGEAVLALTGLVDWGWHAHVAGILVGLAIPPEKLTDNVVELFPQGDQDVWH